MKKQKKIKRKLFLIFYSLYYLITKYINILKAILIQYSNHLERNLNVEFLMRFFTNNNLQLFSYKHPQRNVLNILKK